MKKSMYSLMLAEDVIRAVDKLAAEQGTNRSNMVNQILAEHVSLVTPEKHVGHIFDVIEELMGGRGDYSLYAEPNSLTMSIKSVLRYHYRPTIRYEVEMERTPARTIGQLKILFRTTSPDLPRYAMEEGRFRRTFALPGEAVYDDDEIGRAIGDYVSVFDEMLKSYLAGEYSSTEEIENRYLAYLNSGARLI